MKLLLVERDGALGNFLFQSLQSEGYEVQLCAGAEGLHNTCCGHDLILLDTGTGSDEGVQLVKRVRLVTSSAFIVVLSVRHSSEVPAHYLDAGADDFVSKPFAYGELSARLRALRRRSQGPSDSVLVVGDLKLDRVKRQVERAGRPIELTTKEFSLLEFLIRNAGRGVTRADIIQNVWKVSLSPGTTNVVDVYVAYLRKKIDQGTGPKLIHTVRGVGYQLSYPSARDHKSTVDPAPAQLEGSSWPA
ncbi:MAG TPA: response regulator transcription factor [Terriglobales bacterium]|nr:response regulator transcription factor [Terriglobales bacterium]